MSIAERKRHEGSGAGIAGRLARILAGQGRVVDAEKAYRLACAEQPGDLEWQLGLARALIAQNRDQEAIPALLAATGIEPGRADLHNQLGLLELHPLRAEEAFRAAVAADPDFPAYRLNLALCLIDQWRLPEAEACYLDAITLEPTALGLPVDLGHLYIEMGRFADAESLLRRTLWSLDHGAIVDGQAWTAYHRGQFDEADELFGRRNPTRDDHDLAWAFRGMGAALLALGQDREATVAFRGAVSITPRDPGCHLALAQALDAAGRDRAHRTTRERARQLVAVYGDAPTTRLKSRAS